jgi:feruloyl esterase
MPKCLFALTVLLSASLQARAEAPKDFEPLSPRVSCAALLKEHLDAAVGAAVSIEHAVEVAHEGHGYCEVDGTIAPKIRFEVRLPASGWTQRYLQLGCGGLCGVLNVRVEHADDCVPVREHAIALASTDMGHQGQSMGDGSFGVDPQARIDFAYRGVHLTAIAAKALQQKFYGVKPRRSYFMGCSDGGREALMEAERFPADFDGISAGAPAMNFLVQNTFYHAWMYAANHRADGSAILTAAELPPLHAAALASCDAEDGLKDGQITDPRACNFDPNEALCKSPGSRQGCLTVEQVEVARKLYEGPRDTAGHRFTIGGPQVGSELAWRGVFVPDGADGKVMSEGAALDTLRYLAFEENPGKNFSLADFHFDEATFKRLEQLHPLYDATDTDLSGFTARGGKLLLWHGWSDPHISPINTIAYYQGVRARLGADKADESLRLFLLPGMYHCMGGDGTGSFDALTPLMSWVEQGKAPEVIIAGHVDPPPMGPTPGAARHDLPPPAHLPVTRTRPVYAYPKIARYAGKGSVEVAASFIAAEPLYAAPSSYEWEGAKFMAPHFLKDCEVAAGKLKCP